MKRLFNPGQLVRCNCTKVFKGVIIRISSWGEYKGEKYPIYLVQPTHDSKNNPLPKSALKPREYSYHWLQPIPSIDSCVDYRSWPVVKYYETNI